VGEAGPIVVEALSAFEPLAGLEKREGTLGGSVPLRVAQACVPLLEGNALGHAVVFRRRLVVRSALGRKTLGRTPERDEVERAHGAAVPFLAAHGHLRPGGAWHERLARGFFWSERGVLRVWTGLLVRPPPGVWLRVAGAGNRAPLGVAVRTTYVGDSGEWVPLVVDLAAAADGARLEGDIANVTPVSPRVRAEIVGVADAPELARAHAAFYDQKYFATKKGEVTKKYRRLTARARPEGAPDDATVRVAHVAGPAAEIVRVGRVLGPASTSPEADARGRSLDVVRFANAVAFRAHFDGNTLAVEPDREALARGARAVEGELARALGAEFVPENRGAVWYLTKYFTPHPHGEPHFFLKPWAFTATPPGWSSIVEGPGGDGWTIMRGVVSTDRFHATPAVFHLRPLQRVAVPAGEPVLDVTAVPRPLLGAVVEARSEA
jgi:hypothetical protein